MYNQFMIRIIVFYVLDKTARNLKYHLILLIYLKIPEDENVSID